ncbi:Gmad2 immunoglobulin-like domain-containing protein [Actinospongicola halichondriae]|uniref:Gmad2 immunoglobulin-like domain-containing protein n=1 Tax=Actinospongicola halichondriae TaxID=3236844 RepID=UPI003D5C320D
MTDDHTTNNPDTASRLREALAAHAETIEPSSDGLDRIERRLMTTPTQTNSRRWLIAGGSVAAALLAAVVVFVATDDDDTGVATDTSTTTTTEEATTTSSTTAETTTSTTEAPFVSDVDPYGVAYPSPLHSQRFDSPETAGASYATEVLGFTELVVVEYREGDSRSGEVVISDRANGPETIVLVRLMEDDTWYVLGSQTDDIAVDTPTAGDELSSPFDTTGSALAFEGTVDVIVRTQDDPEPIGEGFVTGSGTPPAGPFTGEIEFTAPTEDTPGIVVYRILSAEDGHVTQATSFPIHLLGS